jgi:Nucleotidyl transferase AbiEii toxin, Type IV TA system
VSDPKLTNIPASVRQKLLNLARERNEDFQLLLTKYGLERVLVRLSTSKHRDIFVLKGALLFELWTHERYRPTRDADFLASGDNSPERFAAIFREICSTEIPDDGIRFDPTSVQAERIKEDADYEGVRVTFTGTLDKAQIPIQIDVGFGDTVTPGPVQTEYPTLLGLPNPHLLAYPRETVVSEKLEAMVKLGIANSRMKDFHDLDTLSSTFEFDGKTLAEAIRATFGKRQTELPTTGVPLAFTLEFYEDQNKVKQWRAYVNKNKPYVAQAELKDIADRLRAFLVPVIRSVQKSRVFHGSWAPAEGWKFN